MTTRTRIVGLAKDMIADLPDGSPGVTSKEVAYRLALSEGRSLAELANDIMLETPVLVEQIGLSSLAEREYGALPQNKSLLHAVLEQALTGERYLHCPVKQDGMDTVMWVEAGRASDAFVRANLEHQHQFRKRLDQEFDKHIDRSVAQGFMTRAEGEEEKGKMRRGEYP
jgi:hypothetical protein